MNNLAILAAAGSRKTEYIVDSALAITDGRVLITTYTNENQNQIIRRIEQKAGACPPHIQVMGWFSFLIAQCAKPYRLPLKSFCGAPRQRKSRPAGQGGKEHL